VRDYIHVTDLAKGHIRAFDYLLNQKKSLTINLGAGKGYSVLELICAFEKSAQKQIPYEVVGRRPGDIAAFYADASLAEKLLGWKAEFDLDRMCQDSWRWQLMNPNGLMD
jgi:UDP-glucose 4-epimerase